MIRLGALGDVVRTLPAFAALRARYPRAHIAWLVERGAESAVRGQAGVDETLVFPREELEALLRARRPAALLGQTVRFVRALRKERFDLVLDFHAILKSGALAWLSGAPVRVGYDRGFSKEGAWRFVNRRARVEPARISRFERNAALVDFLGIGRTTMPGISPDRFALPIDPVAALAMETALGGGRSPVVLHPGTSRATPYKRYPVARWAEVAQQLAQRGERCLVSSGPAPEEIRLAREIVAASQGAAEAAPETATLADLAALFARSRLFLGSDSGPLHVASLVGTPVVQLLGPTDPVENAPFANTPSRQLRVPLACSPCRRGCRPAPCMALLTPAAVVRAAVELLDAVDAGAERREAR